MSHCYAKATNGLGTPIARKTEGSPASEPVSYKLPIVEIDKMLAKYNLQPPKDKKPSFLFFGMPKSK